MYVNLPFTHLMVCLSSNVAERRALFLSKLQAPPSPSAAMTPKTPPESPAILHYSLPSPGLCSPLAMYETLAEAEQLPAKSKGWVEQVDFRLPEGERVQPYRKVPSGRGKPLPSLAQISARFGSQGQVPQVHIVLPDTAEKVDMAPKRRLPSFLQKATPAPASVEVPVRKESLLIQEPVVVITPAPEPTRARKLLSIGRLKAPTPVVVPVAEPVKVEAVQSLEVSKKQDVLKSPGAPSSPKIRITTTVVPRTSSTSPVRAHDHHFISYAKMLTGSTQVDLTESNLTAFNSLVDTRVHTGKNMLSTLRRRSHMPTMGAMFGRGTAADDSMLNVNTNGSEDSDVQKFVRRRSSPAELPRRERRDFAHPVLVLPGAF
jgi:hypothetical protein